MQANDLIKLKAALSQITLLDYGDNLEKDGVSKYAMDMSFPAYEQFWKSHIVPSTNRPTDIRSRQKTDDVIKQMSEVSYAIFQDMYNVEVSFSKIKEGDYGGYSYKNVLDVIIYAGNAVQKFEQIQDTIEKDLNKKLSLVQPLECPARTNKDRLDSERKKIIAYRNSIIHHGPWAIIREDATNTTYMLSYSQIAIFFSNRKKNKRWTETFQLFQTDRSKFSKIEGGCDDLRVATYKWLDDSYKDAKAALDSLLLVQSYTVTKVYTDLWDIDAQELDELINYCNSPKSLTTNQSQAGSGVGLSSTLTQGLGSGSGTFNV